MESCAFILLLFSHSVQYSHFLTILSMSKGQTIVFRSRINLVFKDSKERRKAEREQRYQLSVEEVLDAVPSCVWELWLAHVARHGAGRGEGCSSSRTGGGGGSRGHLCRLGSSHISCADPREQEAEGRRPGAQRAPRG